MIERRASAAGRAATDEIGSWTIARARNGHIALRGPDGSWAESRFAPDTDAARRVEDAGIGAGDRVLVLGGGAGELPAAVARVLAPDGAVVVAEPHPGIHEAITHLLTVPSPDPALVACWSHPAIVRLPPPPAGMTAFLAAVVDAGPYDRVVVHPGLVLPAGFEELELRLADFETRRRSGHRFRGLLAENVAANRDRFLASPSVLELAQALEGEDVIVAGGGPSLAALAAAIGPRAHWIAVGTALGPLALAGIRPHLAVITDPQPFVAVSLTALSPAARPPLVCFPPAASAALDAAPQLIAALPEGEGGRALEPLRAEIGELPAGGTVVTTAMGLAWLLGAARVFLAGVDLVETVGRSHADGTSHAAVRLRELARFGSLEARARARDTHLATAGDALEVETAAGGRALSRRNLALYGRSLTDLVLRRPDVPVLQLNPDALAIPGIRLAGDLRPAAPRRSFAVPVGTRCREHGDLLCV